MLRDATQKQMRILSIALMLTFCAPIDAFGQNPDAPVEVTHGGYGIFGGAVALAVLGGAAGFTARAIYRDPVGVDCQLQPERCRRTAMEHVLVGTLGVVVVAGTIGAGYAAQQLTEKWEWNPVRGWALAGAYLGLPATLLLQNIVPTWNPDWSRDLFGATVGVGGAIGAAYAFRAIALRRGHAWPEFGIGAGGMTLGLIVGGLVKPNTVWVPILGGLGAVIGTSAAALAF